jgi:hypothetical protein
VVSATSLQTAALLSDLVLCHRPHTAANRSTNVPNELACGRRIHGRRWYAVSSVSSPCASYTYLAKRRSTGEDIEIRTPSITESKHVMGSKSERTEAAACRSFPTNSSSTERLIKKNRSTFVVFGRLGHGRGKQAPAGRADNTKKNANSILFYLLLSS